MLLVTRKISELKQHPLQKKVFGDKPTDEFIESVKRLGIIHAPVVTNTGVTISGWMRICAAKAIGRMEVKCIVVDIDDPLKIDDAWAEANRSREITAEQRARWFKVIADVEELKAKGRMKDAPKKGPKTKDLDARVNSPRHETGRAKDIAAEKTGTSRQTAERASNVADAIDKAEANGEQEKADELRDTLNNKSVNAAHNQLKEQQPKKKPKPPRQDDSGNDCCLSRPKQKEWKAAYSKLQSLIADVQEVTGKTTEWNKAAKLLDQFYDAWEAATPGIDWVNGR